jgi:hypothetical protein
MLAAPSPSSQSPASAPLGESTGPDPEAGLPLAGFLVYPSFFAGVIYNDNLYATHDDRKAALGLLFSPNLTAVDDQGLHKTTLTLNGAATVYPDYGGPSRGQPSPTNLSGAIGAEHLWRPMEDLTIDATAAYTRQYGIFGSSVAAGSSFVSSPNLTIANGYAQYSNQTNGSITVEKKFGDQWFLRGGLDAQDIEYEGGAADVVEWQSGLDDNFFLRSGIWLTPQINTFVEGGADLRRYRDGWYDSNAYRLVGGLGSNGIGLFRGEIFAGYQELFSARDTFGAVEAPAFGATIDYYPTRFLTIHARVDQSLGSAAVEGTAPVGSPVADTVQARLQADYKISEYWSASARAGYARTAWSKSSLIDDAWMFGGEISYKFWRNLDINVSYQYSEATSNKYVENNYTQNIVSMGLSYHY